MAINLAKQFAKGLSRVVIDFASKDMSLRPTLHGRNPNLASHVD